MTTVRPAAIEALQEAICGMVIASDCTMVEIAAALLTMAFEAAQHLTERERAILVRSARMAAAQARPERYDA